MSMKFDYKAEASEEVKRRIAERRMKLKEIVDEALSLFDAGKPVPVNSRHLLKRLEELLDLDGTNSFIMASSEVRMLAIPYIQLLYNHAVSPKGFSVIDPATVAHAASKKRKEEMDSMELAVTASKRFIERLAKVMSQG